MIFISYFFGNQCGVGGKRAQALYGMLTRKGINICLLNKQSFGNLGSNSNCIWLLHCLKELWQAPSQCIYLSCGPFIPLLPIVLICLWKKHKLYIDFRDGWSLNIRTNYGHGQIDGYTGMIKQKLSEFIEIFAYRNSQKFIVCTPGMYQEYSILFHDTSKLLLALNGHDMETSEMNRLRSRAKNPYKIVCCGKFLSYKLVEMEKYKKLLAKMINDLQKINDDFIIYFIGTDECTKESLYNLPHTHFLPTMKYGDVVKFMADAGMALALIRDESIDFGTKIFDYIALGIPVYDLFDHRKNFYQFFKKYIVNDLTNLKNLHNNAYTISEDFSRRNTMSLLCSHIISEL